VRNNDFRASGGGYISYQRELVPDNVFESAFTITKQLGFQSMGFDYVVDNRDKIGKIVEISYGFSNDAIMGCNGYMSSDLQWKKEAFNPAREVLKNLIEYC
jgi:hypothetical protein